MAQGWTANMRMREERKGQDSSPCGVSDGGLDSLFYVDTEGCIGQNLNNVNMARVLMNYHHRSDGVTLEEVRREDNVVS